MEENMLALSSYVNVNLEKFYDLLVLNLR